MTNSTAHTPTVVSLPNGGFQARCECGHWGSMAGRERAEAEAAAHEGHTYEQGRADGYKTARRTSLSGEPLPSKLDLLVNYGSDYLNGFEDGVHYQRTGRN